MAEGGAVDGGDGESEGERWSSVGSQLIVADMPEDRKPLVCVEYPGYVDNDARAIQSLGGLEGVSNAFFKSHGLEARLRPEDRYCKPTIARATRVTSLVLRVKRRRSKAETPGRKEVAAGREKEEEGGGGGVGRGPVDEGGAVGPEEREEEGSTRESRFEYSGEVLGVVQLSFEFTGMADFQVLPPGLSRVRHNAQLVDPRLFEIVEPFSEKEWSQDPPTFLPPHIFSKFDKPVNYNFRSDSKPKDSAASSKSKKTNYSIPFRCTDPIPTEPHPNAMSSSHPKLSQLQQLFEQRPAWSRFAVQCHLKLPSGLLRSLLGLVSYYVPSGPWKTLWVKFGYDPRTEREAKVYQCLDFRLPKEVDIVESEWNRRTQPAFRPTGKSRAERSRVFNLATEPTAESLKGDEGKALDLSADDYIFLPNRLPRQRQLFYQLCDLRDERLQAIVHSNDGTETECSPVIGWCEEGSYDKLRKVLQEITKKTADKLRSSLRDASASLPKTAESEGPSPAPMDTSS